MISSRTSIDQMVVPAGAPDRRSTDPGLPVDDRQRFDDHLDRALDSAAGDQRSANAAATAARRTADARSHHFDERARLERRRLEHRPSTPSGRTAGELDPSADVASSDASEPEVADTDTGSATTTDPAVLPSVVGGAVEAQAIAPAPTPSLAPATTDAPASAADGLPTIDVAVEVPVAPVDAVPALASSITSIVAAPAPRPLAEPLAAAPTTVATVAPAPTETALSQTVPGVVSGGTGVEDVAAAMPASTTEPMGSVPAAAAASTVATSPGPSAITEPATGPAAPTTDAADAADTAPTSARPIARHARSTGAPSAPTPMASAPDPAVVAIDASDDAAPSAPASVVASNAPTTAAVPSGDRRAPAPAPTTPPAEAAAPSPATASGERAGHGLPVSVPSLSIDLSDEGLGPLTLQAQQGPGGVHVRLTAGDAAVSDLLSRSGAELRRDLEAGGATLGSLDIGQGDPGQGSAAWAGSDRRGDGRAVLADGRPVAPAIDATAAPTGHVPTRPIPQVVDGVDVRI